MPKVSVLLPSYNHERFVEEAMASVLAQSFSDLELMVVDDGSRDSSPERIRRVRDPRVAAYFQENRGAHAALNRCLELASAESEYVCILNSDDVLAPDWIEQCKALLDARPEIGLCSARVELFGEVSDAKRKWYANSLAYFREVGNAERALLRGNFILTTSNMFFRRSLQRRIGGFRPLRYTHDLDFCLRLVAQTGFALLDRELVRYRIHESNTIGETQQNEAGLMYEFGWIAADRIRAAMQRELSEAELAWFVGDLVASLPMLESGAVALNLVALRSAWAEHAGSRRDEESFALGLLVESSPALKHWLAQDPHRRRKYVVGLEEVIEEQHRVQEKQRTLIELQQNMLDRQERRILELGDLIEDLIDSKYYQAGKALAQAKGIRGFVRLPGQLIHIARQARERESRALAPRKGALAPRSAAVESERSAPNGAQE